MAPIPPSIVPSSAPSLKLASRVSFDASARSPPYVVDAVVLRDSLAFSGSDNSIRLFDKQSLQPAQVVSRSTHSVTSLCSVDSSGHPLLAATSTDGSVSFFDSRQANKPAVMRLQGQSTSFLSQTWAILLRCFVARRESDAVPLRRLSRKQFCCRDGGRWTGCFD
jgi:WD40 repeat protein